MPENNIHDNYLEILKKLKTSKEEHSEEFLELSDILDHSNTLFSQISNASELKLDAKVTEIHSELFLKLFTRNIKNRKINPESFIKLANNNKLGSYFTEVKAINRKCFFTKFIDFEYSEEHRDRKVSERIIKVTKDATTPSGKGEVEDDANPFLEYLDKAFSKSPRIYFYDCVLDYNSFDKTIENIFNVAIAIRSKIIMFTVENEKTFIERYVSSDNDDKRDNHIIMDINYDNGDLAKRKLFPALAKLDIKDTKIIAFARTKYDKPFSNILKEFYTYEDESFCDKITYIKGSSYTDLEVLEPYLNSDTIIYLSLPPEVYHDTLRVLKNYEYKGVAIEKPFGSDYSEFLKFKKYPIDRLYFIDHFLLKPLIVSWPKLINQKKDLKKLINGKYIKNVKICFKEEIGGEGRTYFDTHGLVKDVVQNHISEVLAVFAADLEPDSCSKLAEERIHLFQNTKIKEELSIFGQYNEYGQEMDNHTSTTETFSIVTLEINLDKWKGVPFITISGKGMNEKKTEVVFEFKKEAFKDVLKFINTSEDLKSSEDKIHNIRLICNLTPKNEVYFEILKDDKIHTYTVFTRSDIEEHMREKYDIYENHEIVFNSFIKGESFDAVKFSEAELLWKIYGCIIKKDKLLIYYSKGADIPNEARSLLEKIEKLNT